MQATKEGLVIVPRAASHSHAHAHASSEDGRGKEKGGNADGAGGNGNSNTSSSSLASSAISELGAKIRWGRKERVESVSAEEVRRLVSKEENATPGENELVCFGVVGLQRLFNGEWADKFI